MTYPYKSAKGYIERYYIQERELPNSHESKTISISMPAHLVERLNKEAENVGVPRSRLAAELIEIALDEVDSTWDNEYDAERNQ